MRVRDARPDELVQARSILDAAMLEVPALDDRAVIVSAEENRILGAIVLDGNRVEALAVRPGRRGQGIGRALVESAADRRNGLTAEFYECVVPFYEALGFEVEVADAERKEDRYCGTLK